jgi:hypothetical protein
VASPIRKTVEADAAAESNQISSRTRLGSALELGAKPQWGFAATPAPSAAVLRLDTVPAAKVAGSQGDAGGIAHTEDRGSRRGSGGTSCPAGCGLVLAGTSPQNRPIVPVLRRRARPCLFRGSGPRRGRVRRVGYHGSCENVRRMPFPRPPILASEGCRPEFAAGGGRVRPDARPGCVAASDFRVSRQSDPAQSLRACAPGRRTSGHPATREQAERLMDN